MPRPKKKETSLDVVLKKLEAMEKRIGSPFVHTPRTETKATLDREVTVEFFISDVHFHPEHDQGHDPAAWELTRQALVEFQPDIVVLGGDINDIYAPSRYEKVPRLATPEAFREEMEFGLEMRREIREAVPDARIYEIRSNHHDRIKKSVRSNAPWLTGFIDDLFYCSSKELGIKYVDDDFKIGKLHHAHGDQHPGGGRGNIAKGKFERCLHNLIFGHHHKFASWIVRNPEGGYWGAWGNGTLHWLEAEYAARPDWNQGFSIVEFAKSGNFNVNQVLIHKPSVKSMKASAVIQGKELSVNLK